MTEAHESPRQRQPYQGRQLIVRLSLMILSTALGVLAAVILIRLGPPYSFGSPYGGGFVGLSIYLAIRLLLAKRPLQK